LQVVLQVWYVCKPSGTRVKCNPGMSWQELPISGDNNAITVLLH